MTSDFATGWSAISINLQWMSSCLWMPKVAIWMPNVQNYKLEYKLENNAIWKLLFFKKTEPTSKINFTYCIYVVADKLSFIQGVIKLVRFIISQENVRNK